MKTSRKGEQTRARLVAAARSLLADSATGEFTTRNVAALAGVAPSLCHYYFRDRTELIIAVIEGMREDWIDPFEAAVAPPGGFDDRAERIVRLLLQPEAADLARLHAALHWFALNDDRIRASLEGEYERWATCFVSLFQVLADERGGAIDPRPFGQALAAAADGLAAAQSLGAEADAEPMLRALVRGLVVAAVPPAR